MRRFFSQIALAIAVAQVWAAVGYAQASIRTNFTGSNINQSSFIPPDTMGAVGPNHFVELINGRFAVYNKTTGATLKSSSLDQFWIAAGVTPVAFSFDPRILYDAINSRWIACAVDNPGGANRFLVAASNSSDPTGTWTGFGIDSDSNNSHWADYPMMGMNGQVVVISANMFPLVPGNTQTAVLVVPKAGLLAGSIANVTLFQDQDVNTTGFAPQPMVDYSGGNLPLMLLSSFNKASGTLKTSLIDGTPTAPTLNTTGGFIAVASRGAPPDINQPGPKLDIDAGDSRFVGNVIFQQNPSRVDPSLWAAHGVNIGGRAAIEWYEIDAFTNVVQQSGIISDSTLAFNYPSIAVNAMADVVIGFSGGSPSQFMSTYAVSGKSIGITTTLSAPQQLKIGLDDYQVLDGNGRNRWGDYSATLVDPIDSSHFWTIQEFVSSTNTWAMQVTELIPNSGLDGDRWRFNYPAANTTWLLANGRFTMENDDCTWGPVFGAPPVFGFIFGAVHCNDRQPRFGFAGIIGGQVNGVILQLGTPSIVMVSGSDIANRLAPTVDAAPLGGSARQATIGEPSIPAR